MSRAIRRIPPAPDHLHWFAGAETLCPALRFIAYHRMRGHTAIPLHRVGTLHLALVAGGALHLRIDRQRVVVPAGHAAILRPGTQFTHDSAPNAGVVYFVGLSHMPQDLAAVHKPLRPLLRAMRQRLLNTHGNMLSIDDALLAAAGACFEAVRTHAPPLTRHARAWALIAQLAACLAEGGASPPARRLVQPALDLLHRRLPQAPAIAELAAACGMGRSRFLEVFRQEVGLPPHEWITRHRIESAARRLRSADATVTGVALSLGFASPQHFSTLFKRFMGLSPKQYRQRHTRT